MYVPLALFLIIKYIHRLELSSSISPLFDQDRVTIFQELISDWIRKVFAPPTLLSDSSGNR